MWLIQILVLIPLPALLPFLVLFLAPNTMSMLVLIPLQISNPNVVFWLNREAARAQEPAQTLQGAGKPHRGLGTISHQDQFLHIHGSAPVQRDTRPSLVDGGHCKTDLAPLCAGQGSSRSPSPRDREDEQPPARACCIPELGAGWARG